MLHSIAQPSTELPPSLRMVLHALTHGEGGRQPMPFARRPTSRKKRGGKKPGKAGEKGKLPPPPPVSSQVIREPLFPLRIYYVLRLRSSCVRWRWSAGGGKRGQIRKCAHRRRGFFFLFSSFSLFFAGKRFIFRSPHCCKYWYEDVRYGPAVHMKSEEESPLGLVPISVFSSSSF